ncbi:MAG TPA: efflux RND transporter periplasmic adaptor subunit [Ohtaekwangia sp.]|nr:efflux RND transporter periplasmic adaptor subunit [Ohtaekwangia sp.]
MKSIITKIFAAITLTAGLIVIVISCTQSKGEGTPIPKTSDAIPVKVITVEKSTAQPVIVTSGQITTDDETTLAFKVGGVVHAVHVKEGEKIRKGQLLATLDLTEINALVSQATLVLEKADRDLNRTRNLYQDSVATLEQLQNAETAFALAQEQLHAANFNRSFAEIKAPTNGYVLRKFVNSGQVVGIGDPVVRTNGAGNGKWILKSGVSDKQWSVIRVNDKVNVKVDAFPDQSFEGIVVRKSETADPATGAFTVEVAVKNNNVRFASGMFASAEINSGNPVASWNVPYEAVLDANGNEGFVFVTNDNKKAIQVPVTIVSFNNKHISISDGLEDAKAVIVSGSAYLTDNSPISIVK